jgi:sulfur carrier protein ThiS
LLHEQNLFILDAMKVQLKLIASYRDFLPPEKEGKAEIEIPDGTTAVAILEELGIPISESVILLDGRTLDPDEILQEGNVVFAFHATAGG